MADLERTDGNENQAENSAQVPVSTEIVDIDKITPPNIEDVDFGEFEANLCLPVSEPNNATSIEAIKKQPFPLRIESTNNEDDWVTSERYVTTLAPETPFIIGFDSRHKMTGMPTIVPALRVEHLAEYTLVTFEQDGKENKTKLKDGCWIVADHGSELTYIIVRGTRKSRLDSRKIFWEEYFPALDKDFKDKRDKENRDRGGLPLL